MKLENIITMDLQHFDGGAGGGGAAPAGAAPAAAGGTPDNAGQGAAPEEAAAKERREKWKATKAEYKDLYGEEVKTQIDDRLKKYKSIEEEHKTLTQRLAKLQELAGVEDIDSLEATLSEQQQKRMEEAAYDKGMTVEEYMKAEQERRDAEAYRKLQMRNQYINRMTAQWQQQGVELQKTYPDFDLQRAVAQNPAFVELLQSGKDVRVAYEAANAGQILSQMADYQGFPFETWTANKAFVALLENGFPIGNAFEATELDWTKQRTAKEMEKRVADSIRSGRRIPEAGANQKPGEGRSTNVSGLTSKERARLMEDFRTGKKNPRDYGL